MQRKEENGIEYATDDGSGVRPHSNRHQTNAKPRLPKEYGENGDDVTTQADGEIDKSRASESSKHHLELRPQASWTFSSCAAKIDLKKSKSSSHEGQVFMDEAKRFILFYAESAITVKDLDNNTQETYQYPSITNANPCFYLFCFIFLINNY